MELIILQLVILIMSAAIHEYAHGWAAYMQGDPTAKNAGRLTANPLAHLDWFGSILLPLMLYLSGAKFLIGYAKPVPFNPYNLRDQQYGPAKVAIAGPAANLAIALFFGLFLRAAAVWHWPFVSPQIADAVSLIVYINLLLTIFNLLPIPPLDGSKVLYPFFPRDWQERLYSLEMYGIAIVFIFLMFFWQFVQPVIFWLFKIIVGGT